MSARRVFYATVTVLATLGVAYLLIKAGMVLVVLFIAIVFASAIRPFVDWLVRRRIPRGLAILLVYASIFGGLAGLLVVAIPPLIGLLIEVVNGQFLINQVQALAARLAVFGWNQFQIVLPVVELPRQLAQLMGQAEETAQKLAWPVVSNAVLVVGQFILVLVMGVYWLTARESMLNLLLRMSPLRHRAQVETIWTDVETTLGAYVRGQMILMAVIGLASLAGLLVLGVPYAPALALIAGLTEAVPLVGPILGAIPAVLFALTVSPETALAVAGWYVLVQQLENHLLVPKVMQRAVGLNPLVVIIALIVGGILNGVLGALLAVPVAGALQVIARYLLIEPAIQSNELRTEAGIVILSDESDADQEIEQARAQIARVNGD